MKVLLVSGAARLASQPVLDYVTDLASQGVEVSLATWAAPTAALRDALAHVVVWGPEQVAPEPRSANPQPQGVVDSRKGGGEGPRGRAGWVPAAQAAQAVRRRLRPHRRRLGRVAARLARTGRADRTWLRLKRDGRATALARQADVVVALDQLAVFAVWKLGKALSEPELVYGLPASRNVVSRLADPA